MVSKDIRLKVDLIKKAACCADCGKKYPPEVMDFDHTNPANKIANVSRIARTSGFKKAVKEAKKCEIVCSNCHAVRTKKQRSKIKKRLRNRKLVNYVTEVKDTPCMDCGVKYPHYVMQFDHRDPSKKIADISTMVHKNIDIEVIILEIEKCDVVCSNCHRVRTKRRAKIKKGKRNEDTTINRLG